ncbi:MAG: DUF1846 domain-containing protein [Ruminococcaceae bacterium]|nr:DUF1846 domain-containing protein [Oscillospiraceae bacterium]MBQ2780046.1 DUF1846 domain-containing protein [Clostridia bacterium]MBQ7302554.1 DUF1846 domain-containing protein [Clostridia bacterium]
MKIGFDNALYMQKQKEHILERIARFEGKLYLEFGGKLFDDYHAARVLPGFEKDAKIRLLCEMREQAEVIFCISAGNIEKTKIRADLGISYEADLLRQIDALHQLGLLVNSVVITQYTGQAAADNFVKKLTALGITYYIHRPIKGYPTDVDYICSEEGFGVNPYIETTRPLVVVTAPGPGSGKLATCLSQVYHEQKRGICAGYGKYETFPIWNIPLKHPVNMAYEAATADLQDVNMIDPYHLEAYGVTTVNYNRDVEAFPIVSTILTRITGNSKFYCSPTDMGVNMAGYAIVDDEVCRQASCQEVIRRYYKGLADLKQGKESAETVEKLKSIMQQLGVRPENRTTVLPALTKRNNSNAPAVAIELPDGRIITGKATNLLSATSGAVLNSVKVMADIPKSVLLMSPSVLEPVKKMKTELLHSHSSLLKLDDVLTALYICAASDPTAAKAVEQLPRLRGCELHSTQLLNSGDEATLRKLGMNVTCEPVFPGKMLFF